MKTHWLHFIGKQYYSRQEFVNEACTKGVSRAVSFEVFKKMEFGDRVMLAQIDGKSSVIFGYFDISSVTGLDHEFIEDMIKAGALTDLNLPSPEQVDRGCGSYLISRKLSINDTEALVKAIKALPKDRIGRLMIGGKFVPYDPIRVDITFQMGFRLFDFMSFRAAVDANPGKKIKGQFYFSSRTPAVFIEDPRLLDISNYTRN